MTSLGVEGNTPIPTLPATPPALVATVDIVEELKPLPAGDARSAYLLVVAAGLPIGWASCRVTDGICTPQDIQRAVSDTLSREAIAAAIGRRLERPVCMHGMQPEELFTSAAPSRCDNAELITVAVCTRDRPADLERCLATLRALDHPSYEVIVVDNASASTATRMLVASRYPEFRYVREERLGLNWARNCALAKARGNIIVYSDDDTVADRRWLCAIAAAFEEAPVQAVTGLIAPLELRTDPQLHFELLGGFGRGCHKRWYRAAGHGRNADTFHLGAGRFGAGANMAFRTSVLRDLGGFDPALDVGTPSEGGGDLEIFFRLLHEGHTLVYEPAAIVWHRHRDTEEKLRAQIRTWGTAMGALLAACFLRYPSFRRRVLWFALRWSWIGYLAPAIRALTRPGRAPRSLRFSPLRRLPFGAFRYLAARRTAARCGARCAQGNAKRGRPENDHIAIHDVDLAGPLIVLTDAHGCWRTEIRVFLEGQFVGSVSIDHRGDAITPAELRSTIARELGDHLVSFLLPLETAARYRTRADLLHSLLRASPLKERTFHPALVSIVVATRHRPAQLRRCLASLSAQQASFPFEIVVVDNAPGEGDTERVLCSFELARYVAEPLGGLAPGRNSGFRAAKGDILVCTDDDVVAPPSWLEELVQPFRFAHVGVTTGQVLPLVLTHEAQREFERFDGLRKAPVSYEVGLDWLAASALVPPRVWDLGATANAAIRRSVVDDERVGFLEEALGPGTPAGGGEDAYLLYRALRAGYGVHYEVRAVVFHEHRACMRDLRWQLFDYGRGHVAYLLTTLFRHGDLRAITRLLLTLPAWHAWRICAPPSLRPPQRHTAVLFEIFGYLAGPWCWCLGLLRAHLSRVTASARRRDADTSMNDL